MKERRTHAGNVTIRQHKRVTLLNTSKTWGEEVPMQDDNYKESSHGTPARYTWREDVTTTKCNLTKIFILYTWVGNILVICVDIKQFKGTIWRHTRIKFIRVEQNNHWHCYFCFNVRTEIPTHLFASLRQQLTIIRFISHYRSRHVEVEVLSPQLFFPNFNHKAMYNVIQIDIVSCTPLICYMAKHTITQWPILVLVALLTPLLHTLDGVPSPLPPFTVRLTVEGFKVKNKVCRIKWKKMKSSLNFDIFISVFDIEKISLNSPSTVTFVFTSVHCTLMCQVECDTKCSL